MIRRVIFTREHPLAADDCQILITNGFEPTHVPLITCQPNSLSQEVLAKIEQADWIFFTSAVALEFFKPYFPQKRFKIASIGPQTTLAIKEAGYQVDFEAQSHYAVDFVRDWLTKNPERQEVLLPQSSLSNPIIGQELMAAGHGVTAWAMYDTKPDRKGQAQLETYLAQEDILWTFASPSAFQSFQAVVPALPETHRLAVIGTTTAKAVEEAGYKISLIPQEPSIKKMVEKIVETGGSFV